MATPAPLMPSEYWIATRTSADAVPNVFGPYSLADAIAYRTEWILNYPSGVQVSAAYHANGRDQALRHALFYLPN